MSQWGAEKLFDGVRAVPLVRTNPFAPAHAACLIDDILIVDSGVDSVSASSVLSALKGRFVGAAYAAWEEVPDA